MNEDNKQRGADNADGHQLGKKFPKDGLGFLKIDHEDWDMPKALKTPIIPEIQVTTTEVEAQPEVEASTAEQDTPTDETNDTPDKPLESVEAIEQAEQVEDTELVEAAVVAEITEPTLPEHEEDILPESTETVPEVAFSTSKKSKRRAAAILTAATVALLIFTGVSALRHPANNEVVASSSDDSSQTAVDQPKSATTEPKDDTTTPTQPTSNEQEPVTTGEIKTSTRPTPPALVHQTTEIPVKQKPPVVVEQPAEPTPPAQGFVRGKMTISATRGLVSWQYTGKAIYGYKLVYTRQTNDPTVENSPYITFSSMSQTSLSLPTNLIPQGNYLVRVCASTGNTSGETCVDYNNSYAVVQNT